VFLEENFERFAQDLREVKNVDEYLQKLGYLSELITGEDVVKANREILGRRRVEYVDD
jgi:hypothetical protein